MKTHLKRIGTFLIYTLGFNIVSFAVYFFHAFFSHNFTGISWLVFGIAQICFTILFFNKMPLPKTSNEKGFKFDLVTYFLILSALSIAIAFYRFETDSWFTYIYFNTFHTLTKTSLLDNIVFYIFVCIAENAIKTYLFYTNISKKSLSKAVCIILGVIMIIAYIVFLCLLARGV